VNNPEYNPYAAPTETPSYDFARPAYGDNYILATLGQRFAGNFIDGLVFVVPMLMLVIPMAAMEAGNSGDSDTTSTLFLAVGGLLAAALVGVQCYMISTRGQTIGKRAVKTKIVRLDGSEPGFIYGVLVRGLIGQSLGAVPLVGGIYSLVDTLCIFKQDRRTLRDMIAGTRVIQV
jgi:uncharacterized RDD family membrane protein YckC